ncbi:DUF3105 domain-containing protein [Candidatus Uhrbacteria bacterium]|nr:DUF3105 domain-containing protein [Candidatus Uhrbacteria bacterium]
MRSEKQRPPLFFSLLLVAAGVLALAASFVRENKESVSVTPSVSRDERFADLGNQHIDSKEDEHASYNSVPPTSGPHIGSSVAPWGVHDEQIPDELQVHNLEDGGVIIHYDPVRVDGDTIEKLRTMAGKYVSQLILEPYTQPALPSPIVLTAWTQLLKLEQFDEERIDTFIKKYRGVDHHSKNE